MKTAVAAPAPRTRTMNMGQAILGPPLRRRHPLWFLRVDMIVVCAMVTLKS